MFTNAQNFDTHRSLFNSAARDLHLNIYSSRGDGSQQQPQTADMSPPLPPGTFTDSENANKEWTDVFGLSLPGNAIPFAER